MAKKFTQKETEALIAGIREAYDIKIRQLNYRLDGLTAENRSLRNKASSKSTVFNRLLRTKWYEFQRSRAMRGFFCAKKSKIPSKKLTRVQKNRKIVQNYRKKLLTNPFCGNILFI